MILNMNYSITSSSNPATINIYNPPETATNVKAQISVRPYPATWSEDHWTTDVWEPGQYDISADGYDTLTMPISLNQTYNVWLQESTATVNILGPDESATNVKVVVGEDTYYAIWSSDMWVASVATYGSATVSADGYTPQTITVAAGQTYTVTLQAIVTIDTDFSAKGDTWTENGFNVTITYSASGAYPPLMAAGSTLGTLTPPPNKLDSSTWDGGYINIPWSASDNWEIEIQMYNNTPNAASVGGPTFQLVDSDDNNILHAYLADNRTNVFANYTGALNSDATVYYASNSGGTGSSYQTRTTVYKFTYTGGILTVTREGVQTYSGEVSLNAIANIRCWFTQLGTGRTGNQYWKHLTAGPIS